MNKYKKRSCTIIVSLLIMLSVMVSIFITSNLSAIYADDTNNKNVIISEMTAYDTSEKNNRLYTLVENHVISNMGDNLTISKVKNVLDFNGNKYTLFELSPIGYVIYHHASGKFIEYSESGVSPYLNFETNLYYGGMGQFFYKVNDTYYHTKIADRTVVASELPALAEASQVLSNKYTENIYDNNVSYVENGTSNYSVAVVNSSAMINSAETPQLYAARMAANISRIAFFSNLNDDYDFGYVGNGACGYIAANMLIAYNYFAFDSGLASAPTVFNQTTKTINGSDLTRFLMLLDGINTQTNPGPYAGTVGEDHPTLIEAYIALTPHNLNWDSYSNILEFGVVASLDKGFPVALFGNYPNPVDGTYGNHAVVAYDYQRYGFLNLGLRYRVHYGWENHASTTIEATGTGSSLFLETV